MSDPFTYAVIADHTKTNVTFDQLHAYIEDSDFIQFWWNHIPGVHIVDSFLTSTELAKKLFSFLGEDAAFLVMEVNLYNFDGGLQFPAWKALYDRREDFSLAEGQREEHEQIAEEKK